MRRLAAIPTGLTTAIPAGLLLAAPRMLLAEPADCSLSADPRACRLNQFLNWLHFAVVVLGLLLIAVIVIAVRIVQRNRRSSQELPTRKKDSRR